MWSIDDGPFTYFGPLTFRVTPPALSEITAERYLAYARSDISTGDEQGLVNAMGNAKRAFHLMVDTLLDAYGLLVRNRRCHFVQKLELLDKCGLISLNILRRLNVERNAMEHEFRAPDARDVADSIDVCQLLLLAMERLCDTVYSQGTVGHRETGRHGLIELDRGLGTITVTELLNPAVTFAAPLGMEVVVPFADGRELRPAQGRPDKEPFLAVKLDARTASEWVPYHLAMRDAREMKSRPVR